MLDCVVYSSSMKTASVHQTKTHLARMLKEVQKGETFVILNGSTAVAKLTGVAPAAARRRPKAGTITSRPVRYSADAFQPLTDEDLHEWTQAG